MAKWRLLFLGEVDPLWTQTVWHATALYTSENLDSAMNTLIVEFTDGKLVSCGQSQNIYAEVNIDYCKENDILFTRRMAGGGTVMLGEGQVFYHVIFKGYHFPLKNKILYDKALKGPLQYIRSLGLDARQDLNDIFIEADRKISGNGAGSIEATGVVCGNIISDFDYTTCVETLRMPSNNFKRLFKRLLYKHLTSLKRELGKKINREKIAKGLINAFEKALDIEFKEDELTDWELDKLSELNEQYRTEEWIFMPECFKDRKKERAFIKVTRGLGIVHFTEGEGFEADVIIKGKKISTIDVFDSEYAFLDELIGKDIFEIKPFQDVILEGFRKKLVKYYYHAI